MYRFKKKQSSSATGKPAQARASASPKKKKDIRNELDSLMNNRQKISEPVTIENYQAVNAIANLPVNPLLIQNLEKRNFKQLTEIQDKCILPGLEGRDIMGIAQTGTGKTAAFLMPIIHHLLSRKNNQQAIVIVPTRELAVQVNDEFRSLSAGSGLSSICLIGGTNLNRNIMDLKRHHHVIIGTPGRLKDLKNSRNLNFAKFETAVLDEFDRLLDMGFLKDILHLIDAMPNRKQTILLSATEEPSQKPTIARLLNNPVEVRVNSGSSSSTNVEQTAVQIAPGQDKFTVLTDMLRQKEFEKVLVFIETKHHVTKIWKKLKASGIDAVQIHGNIAQNKRLSAIQEFKDGKCKVLLATDIAARGLDISDVSHVINYEVPRTRDSYIHRIGRTGRAGKTGKAYTLVGPSA